MVIIKVTVDHERSAFHRQQMLFTEYIAMVQDDEPIETMSANYGIEKIVRTPEALEVHVRPEMQMVILGDYSLASRSVHGG